MNIKIDSSSKGKSISSLSKKVSTVCTDCTTDFYKSAVGSFIENWTLSKTTKSTNFGWDGQQQIHISQIGSWKQCFNKFMSMMKKKWEVNIE